MIISYITIMVSTPENPGQPPAQVLTHLTMEGDYQKDFSGSDVRDMVQKVYPKMNDWILIGITTFDSWKSFHKFFTPVSTAEEKTKMKVSK